MKNLNKNYMMGLMSGMMMNVQMRLLQMRKNSLLVDHMVILFILNDVINCKMVYELD